MPPVLTFYNHPETLEDAQRPSSASSCTSSASNSPGSSAGTGSVDGPAGDGPRPADCRRRMRNAGHGRTVPGHGHAETARDGSSQRTGKETAMIEITDFRDRLVLTMSAISMGQDLCVALYGGDRPHIGAVAISQPRPSLADPAVRSATTSVVAVLGHKEDMLARQVSARLAAALNAVVSVTCGIHVERGHGLGHRRVGNWRRDDRGPDRRGPVPPQRREPPGARGRTSGEQRPRRTFPAPGHRPNPRCSNSNWPRDRARTTVAQPSGQVRREPSGPQSSSQYVRARLKVSVALKGTAWTSGFPARPTGPCGWGDPKALETGLAAAICGRCPCDGSRATTGTS